MKKFNLLLTLFCSCLVLLGQRTYAELVTVPEQTQDYIEDVVQVSSAAGAISYNAFSEVPSGGDGTTEAQPFSTFLAYRNATRDVTTTVAKHFVKGNGTANPLTMNDTVTQAQSITLPVLIDSDEESDLIIAAKDTSDSSGATWVVVKVVSSVVTEAKNDFETSVSFDPSVICETDYAPTSCSVLTSSSRGTLKLFLFLRESSAAAIPIKSIINPSSYAGKGLYWDLKFSSQKVEFSSGDISLTDPARPGDSRILLDYVIPSTITDIKEIVVIYQASVDPGITTNMLYGDLVGSLSSEQVIFDDFGTTLEGELKLRNLTNGTTYYAFLGVVDKYYLAPKFSAQAAATPQAIEELLKQQNCFFLTAGFGEDHKVIRGFRAFRDQFLLKTFLGKTFVTLYYKIAPLYAPSIYKMNYARLYIRLWSTFAYAIPKYLPWLFALFLILILRRIKLSIFSR